MRSQLPPPEVGVDEARDLADQVLAGRAYAEARRPPSLQDRLFEWIADRFADLFGALSSSGGRGIMAWIVVGVFGVAVAYLLSRLVRGRGELPTRAAASSPSVDVLGVRSVDEWMANATEAEAVGDWRLGVRCRHRALATALLHRGVISDRPDQTAGEIAQAVTASRPDAGQAVQEATWLFKDTWYGWIEANSVTSEQFAALSSTVLATLSAEPALAGATDAAAATASS